MATRRGKHAFIEQLLELDVRWVFGNPGTTEQAFMDALQDYPGINLVLALHEGVAVGAAEGWARATGRPAFVELHTAPGLGNGLGMIHNAFIGKTPLVVYVGDAERRARYLEPALTGDLLGLARAAAKWVHEVRTADEIPQVLQRAFKVAATTPRGPVVITVPGDLMDEPTEAETVPLTTIDERYAASVEAIEAAAALLAAATAPALIVADGVAESGAQDEVSALARLLGAPIYQVSPTEVCVNADEPRNAGPLPLFDAAATQRALAPYDVVVALGVEVIRQVFPRPGLPLGRRKVVHIARDTWELGKNQPSLALLGDERTTLRILLTQLGAQVGPVQRTAAAARNAALATAFGEAQHRGREVGAARFSGAGLTAERAVAELAAVFPANGVLVDEAVSAQPAVQRSFRFGPGQWFRSRGGGLGAGMSIAVGLQLAQPQRRVLSLVGDGSAMYTITALWTAAHHAIPVTWVVLNNRGYQILKQNTRQYLGSAAEGRAFVGADLTNPDIDFVALAQGMGVAARRVTTAAELRDAATAALASGTPNLIEALVDGAR